MSGLLSLLVAALLLAAPSAPAAAQETTAPTADDLIPDVTLLLVGLAIDEPEALAADLGAVDGVRRAVVDDGASPDAIVHLALDESSSGRPLAAVVDRARAVVAEAHPGTVVEVGGAAVVDRTLADRFARSARWLALLAAALGLLLGWFDGWRRGLAVAAGCGVAVLAATSIGGQAAGSFDGSMASTALPAALAGLVLAVALAARLLVWFRSPTGSDGAARIQAAVVALGPELVLVFAGLVAVSLIVEPFNPGRSAVTVATIGAAVAAIVVLAIVAPALSLTARPTELGNGPIPVLAPDGRDLPLPVVALAAVALAIVSVAAFGRVGGDLVAVGQLDGDASEAMVAEAQSRRGGDPTRALVADAAGASEVDFTGWVSASAERPEVAWIDLGLRRYTAAGVAELAPTASFTADAPADLALVVPAVSPRSVAGQALAERLLAVPLAGDGPVLAGEGSVAADLVGSRTPILVALLGLAAASAIAVVAIVGNRALALVAFGLRLLGGAAAVGLLNLISTEPSMAAVLTLLTVVTIGSSLAELELLRWLDDESDFALPGTEGPDPWALPGPRHATPGQYGAIGLAALGLGGLVVAVVAAAGGGPGTGRLGLALLAAVVIELVVAVAVLRPAVLGQRAAFQTAARPLRTIVHGRSSGDPEAETPPDDDLAWREVVTDLVETEFWLQTEPERANLDSVFIADTPVHRQAAERHANLVRSGLRVVGRNPELRSLRTVRERQPVILTVTVDHPTSQLLDQSGRVVGVRHAERRVGRLWLAPASGGGHRIIESIEMGSGPLDGDADDAADGELGDGDRGEVEHGDEVDVDASIGLDETGLGGGGALGADPDREPSAG